MRRTPILFNRTPKALRLERCKCSESYCYRKENSDNVFKFSGYASVFGAGVTMIMTDNPDFITSGLFGAAVAGIPTFTVYALFAMIDNSSHQKLEGRCQEEKYHN